MVNSYGQFNPASSDSNILKSDSTICHIVCPIGLKLVLWPHVDCVWWILLSNKGQKGHIMCQAHVKSKIKFFWGIFGIFAIFP